MLDWHLGMVETEDGRPRPLGPADALTLLRAWLAPAVLDEPLPVLVAVAGASDVLDGILARAGEPTRIGRDLEGLADACFAAAALGGARRRGLVGPAVTAAELARLGAGFAYALAVWFGTAAAPDPALLRAARLTTPVRIGGLVAAGLGRRRLAEALVLGGCVASVAALGRTLSGP
jgi:phosphatidylglycerophosphate synthase